MEFNQKRINNFVREIGAQVSFCWLCGKKILPTVELTENDEEVLIKSNANQIVKDDGTIILEYDFCDKCADELCKTKPESCYTCPYSLWYSGYKKCCLLDKHMHQYFRINARLKDCPLID